MLLDFEIDELTHSIENVATGESIPTLVLPFVKSDLMQASRKNGWKFNWKAEFNTSSKQVFKLVIEQQEDVIQGLVSLSVLQDHVFMNLLESAPFNFGRDKTYQGVAGNLVAYVCKMSFEKGFGGCMAFVAKTKLIAHYRQTLGAVWIGGQRMVIQTDAAQFLINKYFYDR
jgi:hypothetical protein